MQQYTQTASPVDTNHLLMILDDAITEQVCKLQPQRARQFEDRASKGSNPNQATKAKQPWFDGDCLAARKQVKSAQF